MYISASLIKKTKIGDPVIIRFDNQFGEVILQGIDGKAVGIVMDFNVEGCITKGYLKNRIATNKLLGEIKLISGNICIIDCESKLLNFKDEKLFDELRAYSKCCA